MKKRFMVLAVTGVMSAAMLAGCGEKAAPTESPAVQTGQEATEAPKTTETPETTEAPKGEGAENPGEVGMANPWRDSTEEEANELIPRLFTAPDGAEVLSWMVLDDPTEANGEDNPLVDLQFSLDGNIFDARAQVTGDDYLDLSGLYYEWTAEDEVTLANWGGGNMKGNTYRNINDNGMVDLITWYDVEIGISYSLSVVAEDLDGFDIQAVAEQMYSADNEPLSGYALKDDTEYCTEQIQIAMAQKLFDAYEEMGADADSITVFVDKIYDSEAEAECEPVAEMNLGNDAAAFECHCEIVPAEGADVNILMGANGEQDEETGVITVYLLGVLVTQEDGSYAVENLGTGW